MVERVCHVADRSQVEEAARLQPRFIKKSHSKYFWIQAGYLNFDGAVLKRGLSARLNSLSGFDRAEFFRKRILRGAQTRSREFC